MNAKIHELMVERVMSAAPGQTVTHVREVMNKHQVSCLPVLSADGEPIGIVTSTDVLRNGDAGRRVRQVMSRKVYTVPVYADPALAARIMRNHHIHHVVVTHERKVVGILSTFDLLRLVEEHRFVSKNPPSESKRRSTRKRIERS